MSLMRRTLIVLSLLLVPVVFSGCLSEELSITMRVLNGAPYVPGGTMDIEVSFDYAGTETVYAIGINQIFPADWTFNSYPLQSGSNAIPSLMSESNEPIEFGYVGIPPLPATFVYTVNIPENASGDIEIQGYSLFRFDGDLVLSPVTTLTVQQAI